MQATISWGVRIVGALLISFLAGGLMAISCCAVAGEYGELLVKSAALLEGEQPVVVSETELVGVLEAVLRYHSGGDSDIKSSSRGLA